MQYARGKLRYFREKRGKQLQNSLKVAITEYVRESYGLNYTLLDWASVSTK